MMNQILYTVLLIIGLSTIIYFTEYLHTHLVIQREYTRKIAHVMSSLASLIFLILNIAPLIVLIIAVFFSFLLLLGKVRGYFTSIDSIKTKNIGSILLPLSIFSIYSLSYHSHSSIVFILPLLILGISDPLAWLSGTYYKNRVKRIILFRHLIRKTFMGSAIFFISTFIITLVTLIFFHQSLLMIIFIPFLIAAVDTIVELVCPYGTDNFFVPLITAGILLLING